MFWRIVRHAPEHVQPAFVLLAHTGIDVGPYLRLTNADLKPNIFTIDVPDNKTAYREEPVQVDPRMWHWIERAVPAPLAYKWLRINWKKALKAAKADTSLRLKDLRHCTGQWATNEGVPEAKVQVALRHANLEMTRRYTKQKDKGEVARAVADVMLRAS